MSGIIQWSSCAKHKSSKKAAGAKPNAQRQRALATKRRRMREQAAKKASK